MRKLLFAAAAAATALGGAMVAQAVQAQPYGYYAPAPLYTPGYRYDEYRRRYWDDGYRPRYAAPLAGSVIGPPLADAYARVPFDRFGADPNGMIAADGHVIKCKLNDVWSDRNDRYVTRRVCD
jgi:hypothetical protein